MVDKKFEELRNLDFSEIQDIDKLSGKLGIPAKMVAFVEDNVVFDPDLSPEENFRKSLRIFKLIEQKQH